MKSLHEYSVGQLYHPGRTLWPEGSQYNFRRGGHELILFFSDPTETEIQDVVTGKAEFGLLVHKEALFLLYQFGEVPGGLPWSDASYQWWLVPAEERSLPNPEPTAEERAILTIILVNADTGRIAGNIRAVSLSAEFTAALHKAIRQQARTAWDGPAAYDKALGHLYRKYPTADDMVKATQVRCIGGR